MIGRLNAPYEDERTCTWTRDARFGPAMRSRGVVLDNDNDRWRGLGEPALARARNAYRHESLKYHLFKGLPDRIRSATNPLTGCNLRVAEKPRSGVSVCPSHPDLVQGTE